MSLVYPRTYVVDARLPLIATAAEAVVTSATDASARHYVKWIPELAATLGLPAIDNTVPRQMYSLRSKLVHGAEHSAPPCLTTASSTSARRALCAERSEAQ